MDRRQFLGKTWKIAGLAVLPAVVACRHQYGHILKDQHQDMVGSHTAGAATFNPLIDEAVAKLLGRHGAEFRMVSEGGQTPGPLRICFVGIDNRGAEEMGDFKQQVYEQIDTQIVESDTFEPINRRFVEAGLLELRMRPDELFLPANMRAFASLLEQQGQPFDYLLFATATTGTTENNKDVQRDYLLTLELINVATGHHDKQSAKIRKGYHRTRLGKIRSYNPFSR